MNSYMPYEPDGGSLNIGPGTNYASDVATNSQNLQQDLGNYFQSQSQNDKVAIENSKQTTSLEVLASLSKTLNEQLQKEGTRRIEKQRAEARAMVLDGQLTEKDLADFIDHENQAKALRKQYHNDLATADKILQETGSYQAAKKFKQLSGHGQYAAIETLTDQISKAYGPWIDNKLATDGETKITLPDGRSITPRQANSLTEKAAVRAELRNQYLIDTGLTNVNEDIIGKHRENFQKADQEYMRAARLLDSVDDSERVRQEAAQNFSSGNDLNTYLAELASTVDANGVRLGYAGAWKIASNTIKERLAAGELSEADIKLIEDQKIEDDPKGRTFRELHGNKFIALRKELDARESEEWQKKQAELQRNATQAQQDMIDALPANATNADLDAAIEKYNSISDFAYFKPELLERYRSEKTIDAQQIKSLKNDAEKLYNANLLTKERLAKFPRVIQDEYAGRVANDEAVKQAAGGYKVQLKSLENAVNTAMKPTPDGTKHPTSGPMLAILQNEYLKRVRELQAVGTPNAENVALSEVLDRFDKGQKIKGSVYEKTVNGFVNVLPNVSGVAKTAAAANSQIKLLNAKLTGGNASLDIPGNYYTKEQLETYAKGYGEPGWSPDSKAVYMASKLNVDPLTVINRVRKASGLPALGIPSSLKSINTKVNSQYQQFLNRYQSPERTTRALNTMGFDASVVPMGLGEEIAKAAQASNIDPAIIAGVIEWETRGKWKSAISPAGAQGIGQIMPKTARQFGVTNREDNVQNVQFVGKYLRYLTDYYKGDVRKAIYAYNGGMGNIDSLGVGFNAENAAYYDGVIKGAAKFGYGNAWRDPGSIRPSMQQRVPFITGNTGTSTGAHVDARYWSKAKGGYVNPRGLLDQYVTVNGKPLSKAAQVTSNYGPRTHPVRGGSHFHAGIDYGTPAGTRLDVAAKYLETTWDEGGGGYMSRYQLPNGDEIVLMHGSKSNQRN